MLIPKTIHKVVITDDGNLPKLPSGISRAIESFYRLNPDYKVKLYSHEECVKYIKQHYEEGPYKEYGILNLYTKLKPYAYRCDLMSQLILYNEGGWYSSMRSVCLEPLDVLNTLNKEYYTSVDCPPNQSCMYNAFIGSVPKHPISKKMIDLLKWNIEHDHYGLDCLYPTGPGAYMNGCIDYIRSNPDKCFIGQHTIEEDGIEYVRFGNKRIFKCKYNNARGADNSDMGGTNNYGQMWLNRDIYN